MDNGLFALLSGLLHNIFSGFPLTAVCTVTARVISSLLNFFMNHRLVFQSKISVKKAMARYYMLAVPQMAAQVLLGEKAVSDIEIATLTPSVVFNEELCAQLGIAVPNN